MITDQKCIQNNSQYHKIVRLNASTSILLIVLFINCLISSVEPFKVNIINK